MDAIVNLAKRRGFAFQSSEIYGGIRSSYDYGPLGVELKNNIKRAWWRSIVQLRDDVVGQDAAIIMAPRVWEASGHLESFSDPLVECTNCHQRFRQDHLIEAFQAKHGRAPVEGELRCPNCGGGPDVQDLMGPVEGPGPAPGSGGRSPRPADPAARAAARPPGGGPAGCGWRRCGRRRSCAPGGSGQGRRRRRR